MTPIDDTSDLAAETRIAPPLVTSPAIGAISGTAAVTDDGAATYRIPLTVPPGRAGVEPVLALAYSNRGGDGLSAVGWSLAGLSRIDRCAPGLAQGGVGPLTLTDADELCLDGVPLIGNGASSACDGGAAYRIEGRPAARVVACAPDALGPTQFRVEDGSGRVAWYGRSAAARVEANRDGDGERVRASWWLDRVEDAAGNYLVISWAQSPAAGDTSSRVESWPERIDYTGFGTTVAPNRRVVFEYEPRPDPSITRLGGIELASTRRLLRVRMEAPSPAEQPLPYVRRYDLRYDQSPLSGRSRLAGVKLCDHAGVCLPETKLTYTTATPAFTAAATVPNVPPGAHDAIATSDVTGDGRADLLYLDTDGQPSSTQWKLSLRDGTTSGLGARRVQTAVPVNTNGFLTRLGAYDLDGDGRLEVAVERDLDATPYRVDVHSSTGADLGAAATPAGWSLLDRFATPHAETPPTLIDADADLRADLVATVAGSLWLEPHGGAPADVLAAAGFTDEEARALDLAALRVVDLDGDHDPELVVTRAHVDPRSRDLEPIEPEEGWPVPNLGRDVIALSVDVADDGTIAVAELDHDLGPVAAGEGADGAAARYECTTFLDANGDGLADLLDFNDDGLTIRWNWGGGHFGAPEPALGAGVALPGVCAPGGLGDGGALAGVIPVDHNQDGRMDLLLARKTTTAAEPARLLTWTPSGYALATIPSLPLTNATSGLGFDPRFTRTLDANGDGLYDVLQYDPAARALVLYRQTGAVVDQLEKITDGMGEVVRRFEYRTLAELGYVRPTTGCTASEACLDGGMLVVSSEQANVRNGSAVSPTTTGTELVRSHRYEGGRISRAGDGWLGFARHTITDAITGAVTERFYDQRAFQWTGSIGTPVGAPDHPTRGMLLRETHAVDVGSEWLVTTTDHTNALHGDGMPIPYVQRSVTEVREVPDAQYPGGIDAVAPLSRVVTTRTIDDYGALTREVVDRGAGRVDVTERAVTNDVARWHLGLVTLERVTSTTTTASAARETQYVYEPDGSGRVRDVIRAPGAGADLTRCTRVVERDAFGNATRVDDTPGGCDATEATRTTRTSYDADGIFAVSTRNALGHVATALVHPGLGITYRATDANGLVTSWQFDGFGRPYREDRADGTWTITERTKAGAWSLIVSVRGSDGSLTQAFHDRLGRAVRAAARAFDGRMTQVDTTYDRAGRVVQTTQPYYAGTAATIAARTTYDNAGRVLTVCQHDATRCRRNVYAGLTVDSYDEDGQRETRVTSPQGLVVSTSIYPDGATASTTTFEHGPFDLRTATIDALGNRVTVIYDALGRRTRLDDADIGYTVTTYNAFDEVVTETVPPGLEGDGPITTTLVRDALGRVVERRARDGVDVFEYDTAPGAGVGQLAIQTRTSTDRHYQVDGVVSQRYAYDALGRRVSERWEIEDDVFEIGYGYDAVGRRASVTYPDVPGVGRLTVTRAFNSNGHLASIATAVPNPTCAAGQCPPGVAAATRLTVNAVDAAGNVTTETLGNGLTVTRTFDSARGLPTRLTTRAGATSPVHDVSYGYDRSDDLVSRADLVAGLAETFTYDGAGRLATAQVNGRSVVTHRYDALGSWVGQSDRDLELKLGGAGRGPHALAGACYTTVPGYCPYGATVDARGNVITAPGLASFSSIRYTSFDQPIYLETSVQAWADSAEAYLYDADHQRVRRTVRRGQVGPWTDHVYVGSLYERRTDGAGVEHALQIDGVGQITWRTTEGDAAAGGMRYFHRDRLGSVEVTTDDAGSVTDRASYDAFGEPRNLDWTRAANPWKIPGQPVSLREGFTGHEQEREAGVINMGGRLYLPTARRFLQPDPVVQAPDHGPSLNRYAYALNDPLNRVDPSGYTSISVNPDIHNAMLSTQLGGGSTAGHLTLAAFFLTADGRTYGVATGFEQEYGYGKWLEIGAQLAAGGIVGAVTAGERSYVAANWSSLVACNGCIPGVLTEEEVAMAEDQQIVMDYRAAAFHDLVLAWADAQQAREQGRRGRELEIMFRQHARERERERQFQLENLAYGLGVVADGVQVYVLATTFIEAPVSMATRSIGQGGSALGELVSWQLRARQVVITEKAVIPVRSAAEALDRTLPEGVEFTMKAGAKVRDYWIPCEPLIPKK